MSTGQRYDLYSHDFRVSTHETYARMRDESPVHLQPGLDGETPIWFVTRYDDVVAMLTDNERFVLDPALVFPPDELAELRGSGVVPDLDPRVNTSLLNLDGADHRRLRKLVTKAFTPRIVEQLRPRIQQIADELVDRVASSGRMELVDDFAFPLPITVIAELLGIPVEDQDRFRMWSSTFVTPALTPELQEEAARHGEEFIAYLDDLFARRRAEPTEDLVSALVRSEDEGDHLSQNELYSMVVLLIVAGHETTVSLITNAVHALLAHPDVSPRCSRTCLECRPRSRSFSASTAPSSVRSRAGLPPTSSSAVSSSAAATSRSRSSAPPTGTRRSRQRRHARPGRGDNRHVGFGRGAHYCLGAPLARLETEIALTTLLERLPNLRLAIAAEDLYWRPIPLFRSLASLPVEWDV